MNSESLGAAAGLLLPVRASVWKPNVPTPAFIATDVCSVNRGFQRLTLACLRLRSKEVIPFFMALAAPMLAGKVPAALLPYSTTHLAFAHSFTCGAWSQHT